MDILHSSPILLGKPIELKREPETLLAGNANAEFLERLLKRTFRFYTAEKTVRIHMVI